MRFSILIEFSMKSLTKISKRFSQLFRTKTNLMLIRNLLLSIKNESLQYLISSHLKVVQSLLLLILLKIVWQVNRVLLIVGCPLLSLIMNQPLFQHPIVTYRLKGFLPSKAESFLFWTPLSIQSKNQKVISWIPRSTHLF